jgi:hypothetical protein
MSLGLDDLSKKRATPTSNQPSKQKSEPPAGAWSARSTTARPWSNTGLSKPNRRKSPIDPEAAMNEDWLSLHADPLFYVDLRLDSRLSRLQERIVEIEAAIQTKVVEPLSALRKFWMPKKFSR